MVPAPEERSGEWGAAQARRAGWAPCESGPSGDAEAGSSGAAPVVLVCGFLGPANEHWARRYWGEALALGARGSPVLVAPVSCVGSCHDRACEAFAMLRGCVVDYGEAHAAQHGHSRYGRDYSKQGKHAEWSAARPVHLVGHSLGGNTVRELRYLLSVDYFGCGSSASWVRSTTTLSAPLGGSPLTYALGACEDHSPAKPVRRFSPGYALGLSVHLYELLCRRVGLEDWLDFGISPAGQWGIEEAGFSGWARLALTGGANGGGTPSVCAQDNAAADMTVLAARQAAARLRLVTPPGSCFEFNFVASKNGVLGEREHERELDREGADQGEDGLSVESDGNSLLYRLAIAAKDLAVRIAASHVHHSSWSLATPCGKPLQLDMETSETDGLCPKRSQYESERFIEWRELVAAAEGRAKVVPGQYSIMMDGHDHFSIVPLPADAAFQRDFFRRLFACLRALPTPG